MTITNDERREVARGLRSVDPRTKLEGVEKAAKWYEALCAAVGGKRDPWMGIRALCDRLAELIDPDRDLTCELEPTASERTNAPVRVYECDHCGRSCDSVYAEDYVYCPYCGRLNTAREVEVDDEAV